MNAIEILVCLEVGKKDGCQHPKEIKKNTTKMKNITAIMVVRYSFLSKNCDFYISIMITTETDKNIYMYLSGLARAVSDDLLKLNFFKALFFTCLFTVSR